MEHTLSQLKKKKQQQRKKNEHLLPRADTSKQFQNKTKTSCFTKQFRKDLHWELSHIGLLVPQR